MLWFFYYCQYLVSSEIVINSLPDIPFLSLFDKDMAIELASEHLSFALSVWKKCQQSVSSCQQKKKEIDNIRRTLPCKCCKLNW